MTAAYVKEASTMTPSVPSGLANPKPSASASTANSPAIWRPPRSAGVSQPAAVTRSGEWRAVTARREIGFTMRNSA